MHDTPPPGDSGSPGTPDAAPHIMMESIYAEPPSIIGGHVATVETPDVASRNPTPSDVITVLGDTRQLSQPNPRPEGVTIGPTEDALAPSAASSSAANSLFAHTGGGLEDESLDALMDAFDTQCSESLQTSKWNTQAEGSTDFLSFSTLDTVVNRSLVERVVRRLPGCKDHAQTTKDIWNPVSLTSSPADHKQQRVGLTTRRRLFLLVLLARRPEKILGLIKEGVTDNDLPFVWAPGSHAPRRRGSQESARCRVKCLCAEKNIVRSIFTNWQWKTLSPFLWLSTREEPKVPHYLLDRTTPLPFIEALSTDHPPGSYRAMGGFSVVHRVAIEPSHFNHGSFASRPRAKHPFFAVKTLNRHTKHDVFEREVEALKRMMTEGDLHRSLVRLLATIERGDRYHMIFPWADGNLHEYWEKLYPEPDHLPRGRDLARWMAWELLGLAQAIKRVHDSPVPAGNPQDVEQTGKVYGCHGDIKPENILFFQGNDQSGDRGKLQLADFGLARFHSKGSIRVSANSAGHTDTYRSPEFDMDSSPGCRVTVGPKTDIWSFGAVALEFVAWYCGGWEDLESFSGERVREDITTWLPRIAQDKFFNRYRDGLRVKPAVFKKIESLRGHPRCSRYLRDLLDCIESYLLVVDEDHRASCREACDKFAVMFNKCKGDSDYCTEQGPATSPPSSGENTSLAPRTRSDSAGRENDADNVALAQLPTEASPREAKTARKRKPGDDLEHDAAPKIARQRTTDI
ncbi:hypothetical protein RB595_005927 [Gaeumannomyces hyphopodioides]